MLKIFKKCDRLYNCFILFYILRCKNNYIFLYTKIFQKIFKISIKYMLNYILNIKIIKYNFLSLNSVEKILNSFFMSLFKIYILFVMQWNLYPDI